MRDLTIMRPKNDAEHAALIDKIFEKGSRGILLIRIGADQKIVALALDVDSAEAAEVCLEASAAFVTASKRS
jgi:hypothetical protein